MVNDKILISREERRKKVIELSKNDNVVTLKANIPGENKNLKEASLLFNYFIGKVITLGAKLVEIEESFDGVCAYFTTPNGVEFKNNAQNLEETHPLGRFIDIDVTLKGEEKSLTRGRMRKCFLCGEDAFVCGRNKTHKTTELLRFIKDKTLEYFSSLLSQIIEESMLSELNLEDKFGLVTPTSNGSHNDLNYEIMKGAIEVIKKPLAKAFFIGIRGCAHDSLMQKLIPLGIEIEEEMLKVTRGANAYKGFIFVGGLLLSSLGYTLSSKGSVADIYLNASEICKTHAFPTITFGGEAYKNGFGGLRKEALGGFPTVKKAEEMMQSENLHSVLAYIVKTLEDSVLYKRAGGEEKYIYFKNLISSSLGREKEVTEECIKGDISIGGSADVLISAYMIKKLKEIFYFKV